MLKELVTSSAAQKSLFFTLRFTGRLTEDEALEVVFNLENGVPEDIMSRVNKTLASGPSSLPPGVTITGQS